MYGANLAVLLHFIDLAIDRGNHHVVVAFRARFRFFEDVVASFEVSNVFEPTFLA